MFDSSTYDHGRHLVGDGGGGGGGGAEYLMTPPPHTHTHTHTFWDGKKITYLNIYLRFTVIFTGLIRTTCSHSLPIFRYSEHVQYTEDERKQKSKPL